MRACYTAAMIDLTSVPRPDPEYIRSMFDRMARRYDAFTFWMSLGSAARMRAETLSGIRPGDRVLDIACGTGDLALAAARMTGPGGRVVGLDFSPGMLEVARLREERTRSAKDAPVEWVCRGAETLPLDKDRFDAAVSGFALRGLYEKIDPILDGIRDSLTDGGRIAFVDLTEPGNGLLKFLYRTFFYSWVALLGVVLFGRNYPIAYLPDSSARFLKAGEFTAKLREKGFRRVSARSFAFGAVTLYRGEK